MIRFGLLGCGRIAKRHPELLGGNHIDGAALVAVCDPVRPRANGFVGARRWPYAALDLIDHQVGLMTGVRDYSTGELKHNVVGLAKAAKALKLPIVVTTTARDSMWGPTFPELVEALPGVPIIDRSSVNAFDDPNVAQAIAATGRKKLIFAGISLEVCAAFPAITAIGKGLDAYVAVDASGTFSETKRQVGLLRMLQAGVIVSDYATLMVEILKDNARPEAGAVYGAMDMPWAKLVGQIAHAYGK
jgi:nicotinamidase-related amidase